jgi:hypothetical protein
METSENVGPLEKTSHADTGKSTEIANAAQVQRNSIGALSGKRIAISISGRQEMESLGFGTMHLEDAIKEFARYLLAAGANLVYGGDLRQGGMAEHLIEMVKRYESREKKVGYRIESYLAWPNYLSLPVKKEASLKNVVKFHKIAPPEDLPLQTDAINNPDTIENKYFLSRCLTRMREQMNANTNARIFLGGKTQGFLGKYPGIVEEASLALSKQIPMYLAGAFGGATKAIIDALLGEKPEKLSMTYVCKQPLYTDFIAYYNTHQPDKIEYAEIIDRFNQLGIKGLSRLNGLSEEENRRLFETPHLLEMIFLIIKGLKQISN